MHYGELENREYLRACLAGAHPSLQASANLSRCHTRGSVRDQAAMAGLQYHAIKNKYHNHSMN